MADLLLEIGVEEIPASYLQPAVLAFQKSVQKTLAPFLNGHSSTEPYWTPRRLALVLHDITREIPGRTEVRQGPPARLAWDNGTPDGSPLPALIGFCKKNGVDPAIAQLAEGHKEPVAAIRVEVPPLLLKESVQNHFLSWLQSIEFPKTMFWNSSRFRFARPVRWLTVMLDDQVIPVEVANVHSSHTTALHRNATPNTAVVTAGTYVQELRSGHVEPGFALRRQRILEQLETVAGEQGVVAEIPQGLLAEVANICEAPRVLAATFDRDFLAMPEEVISAPLIHHQRYFPTKKNGEITNIFLFVTNSLSQNIDVISQGNAKVLRARLRDAAFFWEEDRKIPLHQRVEGLKDVVYHNALGSYADKMQRELELGDLVADLVGVDAALLRRTTTLAYADLLTGMVFEFPELEGIMGRYYAQHDSEPEAVVQALEEGRKPRGAGDDMPATDLGRARALTARLETLTGFFAKGIKPTGSKDPFALRRTAIAINKLMALWPGLDFSVLWPPLAQIHNASDDLRTELEAFMRARWEKEVAGEQISTEEIRAAAAFLPWQPALSQERAQALAHLRGQEKLSQILDSYKRLQNILGKNPSSKVPRSLAEYAVDGQEQRALVEAASALSAIDACDTEQKLKQLERLAHQLGQYFDTIFVLDSDQKQRQRNLELLSAVQQVFADFASFAAMVY